MVESLWNKELEQKLEEYWMDGLTTSEIGAKLGFTKNAVIGKVHRLGLPKRESCIKKSHKSAGVSEAENNKVAIEHKQRDRGDRRRSIVKNRIVADKSIKPACQCIHENAHEGVGLFELEYNMCHWPVGDPKSEDFHFCGHHTKEGEIYCDFHKALAYVHSGK